MDGKELKIYPVPRNRVPKLFIDASFWTRKAEFVRVTAAISDTVLT
jgi:hypothetical protein